MSRAVRRPHLAVLAAFLSGVAACFSAGCRKFRSFLLHVSWYFWRWVRCLLGWFRLLWPWQLLLFLLKFFNLILLLTRTSRRSKSFIGTLPDEHNPKSSQSPTKTALGGEALGSSQPHLNHPADHHLGPRWSSRSLGLQRLRCLRCGLWGAEPQQDPWIHGTGLSGWTWTQYCVMN
jgi:hypothetical protein